MPLGCLFTDSCTCTININCCCDTEGDADVAAAAGSYEFIDPDDDVVASALPPPLPADRSTAPSRRPSASAVGMVLDFFDNDFVRNR
jgi:hypothetical protein